MNMRSAITSLILALDMLVCPFACHGFILASESGDTCCPSKMPCSGDDSPSAPAPGDDGSCGSCLCGGAIRPDEIRVDFEIAQRVTLAALLPILTNDPLASTISPSFDRQSDGPGMIVSGAALRAFLQSFLL